MPDYEFGEPWSFEEHLPDKSSAALHTNDGDSVGWPTWQEDVFFELPQGRRILACVNACAGIPTETIEKIGLGGVAKMFLYKATNAPGPEQEGEPK